MNHGRIFDDSQFTPSEQDYSGVVPLLQIEAHGNEYGLALTQGQSLEPLVLWPLCRKRTPQGASLVLEPGLVKPYAVGDA